jgi:hypothetical protein
MILHATQSELHVPDIALARDLLCARACYQNRMKSVDDPSEMAANRP